MAGRDPVARAYAQALEEAGGAASEGAFQEFMEAWRGVPELRTFLTAPNISPAHKREAMSKAFSGIFMNFLSVVLDKGRANVLPHIHEAFVEARDRAAGRVRARLSAASSLTAPQAESVKAALAEKLKKEILLEETVRPELLGGMRIQVGDWVADGTLARRLKDLSRDVLAARPPEGAWA